MGRSQQPALAGLQREQALGSGKELLEGHSSVLVSLERRKRAKAECTEGMR